MKYSILILSFLMASSQVLACSPVFNGKKESVKILTKESFERNDVIAIALVTKIKRNSSGEVNAQFNILHSYKGNLKNFETGWEVECCMCNMQFKEGKAYVVHAKLYDDGYWVSEFGLSTEISKLTPKQLKFLQKYSK